MARRVSMVTEPNVVPMIDVLLVLLIIFMLSVTALSRKAYDVVLPQPSAAAGGSAPIVLSVSPGPEYVLNGRVLPASSLRSSLEATFNGRPDNVLFVNADRRLSYQAVIDVFDTIRGAGIRTTAIVPPGTGTR